MSNNDPKTTSFKFHLMPKQTLVAQGSTITPPGPTGLVVTGSTEAISTEVVQQWLSDSLRPLIGDAALKSLQEFINEAKGKDFLELVRQHLVATGHKPKH